MLTMETTPNDSLSRRRRRPRELDDVIAFFERDVVSGAVEIDQNAGNAYPEIYYEPIGGIGRFTFNRTSSMVSELAPVILFLKHLVQPGDLVILEEPESHLHPAIQQQMARAIVRLKNAGVKVLITTHSDLFLGSINNLMKLHSSRASILDQLGLEEQDRLDPHDVAAYQFVPSDTTGSNDVIRLGINEDSGIEETEFSTVVERLYDESIGAAERHEIMIQGTFPDKIFQQHLNCCLVSDCEDECCELMVDGWSIPPLTLIRGGDYQRTHRPKGPLCDFTIFGRSSKRFVCAVEMKGGNNLETKHAVEQIQAGLLIAESMVQPGEVRLLVPYFTSIR